VRRPLLPIDRSRAAEFESRKVRADQEAVYAASATPPNGPEVLTICIRAEFRLASKRGLDDKTRLDRRALRGRK
jgi:hypothetical protein